VANAIIILKACFTEHETFALSNPMPINFKSAYQNRLCAFREGVLQSSGNGELADAREAIEQQDARRWNIVGRYHIE
jgi:hypothetical protein